MRIIGYRRQRTPATESIIDGVGLVTGARVRVRLRPAAPDTGLVFQRTDCLTTDTIPALASQVTDTKRRTTLGSASCGVTLVEHLLAALSALRVDNCVIEIDGPEPPGLDGSAEGYVKAISTAGIVEQAARRPIRTANSPVVLTVGGATIAFYPATEPGLRASYLLDYGAFSSIPRQRYTLTVDPVTFSHEVAPCRTFVTDQEAAALKAHGIGKHLKAADLLVFGPHGPIDNHLRFADEPARHKVLDMLGDLALCGFDLAGHVVAYRSGHALNVELACKLALMAERTESATPPPTTTRLVHARVA